MKGKLSEKERRFVDAYLGSSGGNATRAAIAAGYSRHTARQLGARLLSKVHVQAAIAQRQAKLSAEADVTAERVIQELARIGFADIRLLFDAQGQLRDPQSLSDAMAAAVVSVEVTKHRTTKKGETSTEEYVTKVRMADKIGALSLLCRKLGLLRDKMEVTGKVTLEQVLEASRADANA